MVAIITRAQWGAAFPRSPNHVPLSSRRFFVVHWPASGAIPDEMATVRAIERQHRNQGWSAAPGYHFLVGQSGRVYEGAGRDVRGVHSPPRNTDGFGICCLQPMNQAPSAAMLASTRGLYEDLNRATGRTLTPRGHSDDFATACPGPQLIAWVRSGMGAGPVTPPPGPTPPPPSQEVLEMAVTQVFRPRPGQLSFAQVAGNALWHKWSNNNGESWNNECLISPGGPPGSPITARLRNDSIAAGVESDTMFITCESDPDRRVWVARQGLNGRWDIRVAP